MKYFIVVDDSILENFRVDNYKDDQRIMVVLDESLSTRGFLLRPFPTKKNFDDVYSSRRFNADEIIGWNACIKEMENESSICI